MFRLHLISDWRQAHKWSSIRFMALGAAAQTTVLTADRTGLSAHLPAWTLTGLSMLALACIFLGAAGRVTTIDPKDDDHEHHEHVDGP